MLTCNCRTVCVLITVIAQAAAVIANIRLRPLHLFLMRDARKIPESVIFGVVFTFKKKENYLTSATLVQAEPQALFSLKITLLWILYS